MTASTFKIIWRCYCKKFKGRSDTAHKSRIFYGASCEILYRMAIIMKKANSRKQLYNLVTAAVFAALIAVMTAFIKFNTGINNGYLHFGDSMIYLASCILPMPYAVAAAAVGGFTADMLAGAALWAPFTAIIKALNAVPFALVYTCKWTKSPNRLLNKTTAFMPFVSGLITVFGYLLAESLLYAFETAVTSVPFSIIQATGSAIIYYIAAPALDKVHIKSRIYK